jgi:hypothetical protein
LVASAIQNQSNAVFSSTILKLRFMKSIFKTMKGLFLRAIAFLAAVFSYGKSSQNSAATHTLSYQKGGSAGAIQRFNGRVPFYMHLRYKRNKKGKIMAWS